MSKPRTHQRPEGPPYRHGCCVLSAGCWPDPQQESEPTTKDWTPPSAGKSCHMGSLHPGPHAPAHGQLWTFPKSSLCGNSGRAGLPGPFQAGFCATLFPGEWYPPSHRRRRKSTRPAGSGKWRQDRSLGSPHVSKPQLPLGNPRSSCCSRSGPPGPSARRGLRTLVRRARQGGRVGSLRV